MSIDYSDMAFPKLACKKKRKSHKKSILKSRKGVCYLCLILYDDPSKKYTEEHHIMFGSGQRELSEADGLKVDLCLNHHKEGPEAVHNNREMRELLCRIGTIGNRLKYLRKIRGLTRKEAAVKLDMKEERLQDLETGRKGLTLGEAIKYADTYNVPLEYIAGRKKVEY